MITTRTSGLGALLMIGTLLGCGGDAASSSSGGGGAAATGGGTTGGASGGGSGGAATGGSGGWNGVVHTCTNKCTTPADCGVPTDPAMDADNWACEAGACKYLGCNTDEECKAEWSNPALVCALDIGATVKSCVTGCSVQADCVTSMSPAFDGDNWACEAGLCRYTGCGTDQDCKTSYQAPNYACILEPTYGITICTGTCSTANDCATPGSALYGVKNWICDAGACRFTGCKSDKDCIDGLDNPNSGCH